MPLNADILWSFSTLKFMKVSFQETRRNRGWGAQGKGKLRNYVQALRSRRFEIIEI